MKQEQQSKTEPQQQTNKQKAGKGLGSRVGRMALRPRNLVTGRGPGEWLRLRTHRARGGPRGQRFRPRSPAGLPGPEHVGEMLALFPSDPWIPQSSRPIPADSLTMSGPFQAWKPLPSPSLPSGVLVSSCLHFSSPPFTPDILPGHVGIPSVPLGV